MSAMEMPVIGLDVGSTTVKAVVVDPVSGAVVWKRYERHETRLADKVIAFLEAIERDLAVDVAGMRVFITGSGGVGIARHLRAEYVQEVNAVALAVERWHPQARSVIELGGQDAKIIHFVHDPATGQVSKTPSMNDKCAGGTGAVIDKISAKLGITAAQLASLPFRGVRIHQVAGKCGVFAETDINGLQKLGVPAEELMASLFEAIVLQNLSVLTRGNTLMPQVLLLGGPNTFIPALRECWQVNLLRLWDERGIPMTEAECDTAVIVPPDAQYFAALGAVEFGLHERRDAPPCDGLAALRQYAAGGSDYQRSASAIPGLCDSPEMLERFRAAYSRPPFSNRLLAPGSVFRAFIGIDGGSTSTKAVLLDENLDVAFKAYRLSCGNPIEDARGIFEELRGAVRSQGAQLRILGVGTTGYAKEILRDTFSADVALVETVAHTQAAKRFFSDVDVICDVGGQDIKIIVLKNGNVVDFKLNTQCSAGNGYFLQSTAEGFGYSVDEYADAAFSARMMPDFGYGCAVFLQADIVNFQRLGWKPQEILAGLANVLPKNIWLYVSQFPNLAMLGRTFVLQGGTQNNLAAVMAQVNFIQSRFKGTEITPSIIVHPHAGEAGAIGCAVEAARLHHAGRETTFIGIDQAAGISYTTHRGEETRCTYCSNACIRTFIDVISGEVEDHGEEAFAFRSGPEDTRQARFEHKFEPGEEASTRVPLPDTAHRLIIAGCEKGTVESTSEMRSIAGRLKDIRQRNPNLVEEHARRVWTAMPRDGNRTKRREMVKIGIPRALNLYQHAPFFTAYLAALGVPPANIIFSDPTTDELYREGVKRGSIDPCFPGKLALAHVHNLLFRRHPKDDLDCIFFPIVGDMPSDLTHVQASRACPTIMGSIEAVKSAFTKEQDHFGAAGVQYLDPFITLGDEERTAHQMYRAFRPLLRMRRGENDRAVDAGYAALERFARDAQARGTELLAAIEAEGRLGIVVLGRPYHADAGINHGIIDEFRKLGYPVFSQEALPRDSAMLERLFGEDVRAGIIRDPMDIADVWKNSYSENTSRKIWAAKFVARHPNLVALDLSSFKCGHDAPVYNVVQNIIEMSGTPYFAFKDIDENRPASSIRIRVETIAYFLRRHLERIHASSMDGEVGMHKFTNPVAMAHQQ